MVDVGFLALALVVYSAASALYPLTYVWASEWVSEWWFNIIDVCLFTHIMCDYSIESTGSL